MAAAVTEHAVVAQVHLMDHQSAGREKHVHGSHGGGQVIYVFEHRHRDDQVEGSILEPLCSGLDPGAADDLEPGGVDTDLARSEEHTSELQSHSELVCRL